MAGRVAIVMPDTVSDGITPTHKGIADLLNFPISGMPAVRAGADTHKRLVTATTEDNWIETVPERAFIQGFSDSSAEHDPICWERRPSLDGTPHLGRFRSLRTCDAMSAVMSVDHD